MQRVHLSRCQILHMGAVVPGTAWRAAACNSATSVSACHGKGCTRPVHDEAHHAGERLRSPALEVDVPGQVGVSRDALQRRGFEG